MSVVKVMIRAAVSLVLVAEAVGLASITLVMPTVSLWDALTVAAAASLILVLVDGIIFSQIFKGTARFAAGLIASIAVVGILSFLWRQSPDGAFQNTFGVAAPPAVHDIVAERRYIGGWGDQAVVLRFHADEATITALRSARHMSLDERRTNLFKDEDDGMAKTWENFARLAREPRPKCWKNVKVVAPRIYTWQTPDGNAQAGYLLWDAATGWTYVVHFVS